MKTLLIIPPLDEPSHPYPAVPQLLGWLREKGRDADGIDLNISFYRWLFSEKRLEASMEHAWNLLDSLNRRSSLTMEEREILVTLADAFAFLQKAEFGVGEDFSQSMERLRTIGIAVMAAKQVAAISFAREFPGKFLTLHSDLVAASWHLDCMRSDYILDLLKNGETKEDIFDEFYRETLGGLGLERYGLVGISIPFITSALPVMKLLRAIRRLRLPCHLTLGGSYVSINLSKIRDASFFDYADSMIVGDGEKPLVELIDCLSGGNPRLTGVSGAIWREDGEIVRNAPSRGVPLEDLPVAYSVLPSSDYPFTDIGKIARMRLTKGCSWARCAFCGIVGCGLVPLERPDENKMFEKVKACVERGATDLVFFDEEATFDMLERFANRVLDAGLKFNWSINIRFDPRIDLNWAALLSKAGCRTLLVGLENYNDRILTLMNKGISTAMADRCLEKISWSGIKAVVYMILGLPTETEEEGRESFAKITAQMDEGNITYAWYASYFISEGSPVQRSPQKYGVKRYIMPKERDLAFYTEDFEHSGMDKETRRSLRNEFAVELNKRYYKLKSARYEGCSLSWGERNMEVKAQ
jgi:radical SAM superfamily enzyme YgiQ (UPF0313 family)